MNKKRRCLMLIAMSLSLFSCNSKKTVFPDYMYEEDNEVMDEYSLKDVNNFKSEKEDINKAFKDNYVDDINLINKDTITYGELFLANKRTLKPSNSFKFLSTIIGLQICPYFW